ncbi:MAG: hypothetical protein QIT35_gp68 [Methanophagales virus PBV299]|uniref:Uncharacterized protein n=1 Tax=Methanophagales virus PBV299 TaxID=2987730 RepID=A0ABY6GLI1_9CAUD|nr:MAG: hypothetical protein QIT35_gp68 [Methanophagales virus PBV299]UYL64864.1 MAG: hypothetical protein OFDIEDLO_00068 [Methanophagales virus PBV299]
MRSDNLIIKHSDGLVITYILLHDSHTAIRKYKTEVEEVPYNEALRVCKNIIANKPTSVVLSGSMVRQKKPRHKQKRVDHIEQLKKEGKIVLSSLI